MSEGVPDHYISQMKAARGAPAVLKLRLAQVRSACPETPIFAFEGDDDKLVYYQWIRQVRPLLSYEPFVCRGKGSLLSLRAAVLRDVTGLKDGIYFFVDRDYDDLRDQPEDSSTFVTEFYSVENYLVSTDVLDLLLQNEFHCEGKPDLRRSVLSLFNTTYEAFLERTKEVNRRIYIARMLKIEIEKSLPTKWSHLSAIHLDSIGDLVAPPEILVPLKSNPSIEDWKTHSENFDKLDPRSRYRGKFAMIFFLRWLDHLASDYASGSSSIFRGLDTNGKARVSELRIGNFASKSPHPSGLKAFVEAV